jgi:DNA-binding NtrC family response regulator
MGDLTKPQEIMKIVIFNEELRSEMQMYLALSNHYDVEIAQDYDDLMGLLENDAADLTFVELSPKSGKKDSPDVFSMINNVIKKHPKIRVIGICDHIDQSLQKEAADHGIIKVISRPIKNRELIQIIEE